MSDIKCFKCGTINSEREVFCKNCDYNLQLPNDVPTDKADDASSFKSQEVLHKKPSIPPINNKSNVYSKKKVVRINSSLFNTGEDKSKDNSAKENVIAAIVLIVFLVATYFYGIRQNDKINEELYKINNTGKSYNDGLFDTKLDFKYEPNPYIKEFDPKEVFKDIIPDENPKDVKDPNLP